MTPADLRAALAALELTQGGFARLVRVDARTVRRWVAGDREIPGPVIAIVEWLTERPAIRRELGIGG